MPPTRKYKQRLNKKSRRYLGKSVTKQNIKVDIENKKQKESAGEDYEYEADNDQEDSCSIM